MNRQLKRIFPNINKFPNLLTNVIEKVIKESVTNNSTILADFSKEPTSPLAKRLCYNHHICDFWLLNYCIICRFVIFCIHLFLDNICVLINRYSVLFFFHVGSRKVSACIVFIRSFGKKERKICDRFEVRCWSSFSKKHAE